MPPILLPLLALAFLTACQGNEVDDPINEAGAALSDQSFGMGTYDEAGPG